MSESNKSQDFIKQYRDKYGQELYIEKVINSNKTGEPDIQLVYKGMPLYAEAKLLNSLYETGHPFKEIQLYNLAIKAKAGAVCVGILYREKEIRYLMYDQLKKYLNKEDWDKAEPFDLFKIREEWIRCLTLL